MTSLRTGLSPTTICQSSFHTYSLVCLPLLLHSWFGRVLSVTTSNWPFFARQTTEFTGASTLACVPMTAPGCSSQNMLCVSSLRSKVRDAAHFSFFHSSSLPYTPSPWQFCPDVPTIVPHPLMLPSRVVAQVVSHPFCLRGLPPPSTSPSETLFRVLITALGLSSQTHPMARHTLSVIPPAPISFLAVLQVLV